MPENVIQIIVKDMIMPEKDTKYNELKTKIDALEGAFQNTNNPWIKNISIWISICALLFSFGTTIISYKRAESLNNQALKAELREVLQRLSQLPTENFEKSKKYKGDETAIAFMASQYNQEAILLAKQSLSIVKKIPSELVTSIEYSSVALALQNAFLLDKAMYYLELAKGKAEGVNDEVGSLRGLANLNFISGQPELGRNQYTKALAVFSKYQGYNDYTIKSTHIWTYQTWAYAEAGIGRLDLANQKLKEAKLLISTLMRSPGRLQLEAQIDQIWKEINSKS